MYVINDRTLFHFVVSAQYNLAIQNRCFGTLSLLGFYNSILLNDNPYTGTNFIHDLNYHVTRIGMELDSNHLEVVNISNLIDERLSTVEATNYLLDEDMSRKGRKKVVDAVAASVILDTYLRKVEIEKRRQAEQA